MNHSRMSEGGGIFEGVWIFSGITHYRILQALHFYLYSLESNEYNRHGTFHEVIARGGGR